LFSFVGCEWVRVRSILRGIEHALPRLLASIHRHCSSPIRLTSPLCVCGASPLCLCVRVRACECVCFCDGPAPLQITCATLLYLFAWRGCDVAIAYLEYTLKSGSCKSEADFQERSSSIAERSSVVKRRTGTSGTDRTADRYRSSSNSQMRT
jgi:hypothetical protein